MIYLVRLVVRLVVLALCIVCSLLFGHESLSRRAGSADIGRRPPAFTEVYHYTDGLEVEVTEVWIGRRLEVPVVELTVEPSQSLGPHRRSVAERGATLRRAPAARRPISDSTRTRRPR